jgi:hypothetical protein
MTSKIIGLLIVIAAAAAILFVASKTVKDRFYDGAVFDYTQPTVYDYDYTGVYYENGAPFAAGSSEFQQRMLGWKAAEIKLAADAADAYALRKASAVHDAKRKAAEYRELAAERDMMRERAMKQAAEGEAQRLMSAAQCHEQSAKAVSQKMAEFRQFAKDTDAKIASLGKDAVEQARVAKREEALAKQSFSRAMSSTTATATAAAPGSCRTMLMMR